MTTLPNLMRAMAATAFPLDAIKAIDCDVPAPKRSNILVKISAATLPIAQNGIKPMQGGRVRLLMAGMN